MTSGGPITVVNISQYSDDFELVFQLYSSDTAFFIESGTSAGIRGTKSSGTGYSAEASISGTTVTVQGHKQMTAVAGKNIFEIVLYHGTKEISSANFILYVEDAAMSDDVIKDQSVIHEIENLDNLVESAQQAATASANSAEQSHNYASQVEAQVAIAKQHADNSETSKNLAEGYAYNASNAATQAGEYLSDVEEINDVAKSWAVGPNGSTQEQGTDTNNAKYWAEQAHIASTYVIGVKGSEEIEYRSGNVSITAGNVGAYTKQETDNAIEDAIDEISIGTLDIENETLELNI